MVVLVLVSGILVLLYLIGKPLYVDFNPPPYMVECYKQGLSAEECPELD